MLSFTSKRKLQQTPSRQPAEGQRRQKQFMAGVLAIAFVALLWAGFLALFALAMLANWMDKRKRKKAHARIAAPFSFLVGTRFRQE